MSDPVLIALIVTIPAVINAISALKLHQKVDDVKKDVGSVKDDVGTVKEEINGRMGELLKVTGESENAKGMLQGKKDQQAHQDRKKQDQEEHSG
jgi:Skp family chaperone for outer membrane proteins